MQWTAARTLMARSIEPHFSRTIECVCVSVSDRGNPDRSRRDCGAGDSWGRLSRTGQSVRMNIYSILVWLVFVMFQLVKAVQLSLSLYRYSILAPPISSFPSICFVLSHLPFAERNLWKDWETLLLVLCSRGPGSLPIKTTRKDVDWNRFLPEQLLFLKPQKRLLLVVKKKKRLANALTLWVFHQLLSM